MSTSKLILNLFGEIVTVDTPQNLIDLRQKISEKFVFKKSDVDELILTYTKESKNINIETEEDYKAFLDSKINKIQIDISQSSHIYQENLTKIKEEKENDEKKYNELIKQNEEYKKLLSTKFISQKQEIIDISKQIQELFTKRKKIVKYIKMEKTKILKMKKCNDKAIVELKKKLGLKSNKQIKNENSINMNKNKYKKNKKIKFGKKDNSFQNKKLQNSSQERRINSPIRTSPEISIQNISNKNYNKINIRRKISPVFGYNMMKEKKIIGYSENKNFNSTNPFYEEKEELKGQKHRHSKNNKISELICNTIKNSNDVGTEKNINKKNNTNDKSIKNKEKKDMPEKHMTEECDELNKRKNIEKTNEVVNNLIKKPQKYEQLLSNSKEKLKNENKKIDEKKNEKKVRKFSKNKNNKKVDIINIKNNK